MSEYTRSAKDNGTEQVPYTGPSDFTSSTPITEALLEAVEAAGTTGLFPGMEP